MSDTKKETNDLYQKLRQYRGSIAEVCKKSNRSREWVSNVLAGKYPDANVIIIATSVLKKRYEEERKAMEEVTQILNDCDVTRMRSVLNAAI